MPLYDFKCGEGHQFERSVSLAHYEEAQYCDCGAPAQRMVCAPRVISDNMEAVLGPDGRKHDSVSSYKASLLNQPDDASDKLHIIDGKDNTKFVKPQSDRREIRESIKRGIEDVRNGRVPYIANIGEAPNV